MARPLNPKSPASSSSGPDSQGLSPASPLYQQGVAAFKQRNYPQALTLFQQVSQMEQAAPADRLKAEMGLVQVYRQLGQHAPARQRCQAMLASPSAAVRQWASQTLARLPEIPEEKGQGAPLPPQGAVDQTGFVPLESADVMSPPTPAKVTPLTPDPAAPGQSPQTASENGDLFQAGSLFQYQRLNQQVLENPDLDPTPSSQIPTLAGHTPSPLQPEQTAPQPHRGTVPPSPEAPFAVNAPVGKTRSRPPQAFPLNLYPLWLMELATAVLVIAVISGGLHLVLQAINRLLRWVQWPISLGGVPAFDRFPLGSVLVLAIGLTLASPWLMDLGLARWHRQRPLTTRQLQTLRPDTITWLRQVCRQQGWQLPHLRLVPDPAPLCFSYGWRPGNTRLVISQGLLDSLSEDDLTTLYTYELAHLANGDLPLMSAMGVPLLVLHTAYGQLSRWGDRLSPGVGRLSAGILASGFYGVFWLLRQLVLWFSRVRSEWCDRRAMTFLPSPTALPSGLIHLFTAISTQGRQTGHLHPLLGSLDVLMPVGSQPALSPGSFLTWGGLAQVIAGDYLNPYRRWLMTNASHPPLADRVQGLIQVVPQGEAMALTLDFQTSYPETSSPLTRQVSLPLLVLQKAPLAGLLAGSSVALGLWILGKVVESLGWQRLGWFYQDSSLLWGGLWLGLGLGLMMRINTLYPNLPNNLNPTKEAAATLLEAPITLPVQGQPGVFRGKLLGPKGLTNGLCQALYLDCGTGIVKLEVPLPFLYLPGLRHSNRHPADWLGRTVTVLGWQRRGGGLLWLDVQEIRLEPSRKFFSHTPIWMTLLSLSLCLFGVATIFTGG